ncbi:MAG: hypothetical protein B7Z66_06745 [Chromatiales bacterium 21-64-14]|nr:MAG: hypothetical protein B7Z66_06745 [Chromatiales bacterium 21-64-14]HQU16681.1 DUF1631 family protein [Gammaproteobacteria bacterium]
MAPPDATATGPKAPKERRAFPRHPVRLPARLESRSAGDRPCIIRDYCVGGLLLIFEDTPADAARLDGPGIRRDEQVQIGCVVTSDGEERELRFSGRIVRADGQSAGLAFIDPDPAALQRLRDFARGASEPGPEPDRPGDGDTRRVVQAAGSDPVDRAGLMRGCNDLLRGALAPIISGFLANVNDELFKTADTSRDMALQNANLQALGVLNRQRNVLQDKFVAAVEQRLRDAEQGILASPLELESTPPSGSLALVEPLEFEEWLSTTDIVSRVETEHRESLQALSQRLSVVLAAKVDNANNPYGPAIFAESFQEALAPLDIAHGAKLVCYKSFRNSVRKAAEPLYKNLNQFLIDHQILSEITYAFERHEAPRPAPSPDTRSAADASAEPVPLDDAAQGWRGDPGPARHGSGVPARGGPASAPSAASPSAPGGGGAESPGPAPGSSEGHPRVPAHDLYQLVGELRSLHNQLVHSPVAGRGAGTGPAPAGSNTAASAADAPLHSRLDSAAAALQSYSTAELLEALSSREIERHRPAVQGQESGASDFRARLEALLAKGSQGGRPKTIMERQGQVIDVASNVFRALLTDFQVAQSVRPWIEKLEIPVLKMAILDDRLFVDKSHVVRQVINKFSELEILAGTEEEQEQAAIQRAFLWIVNLINTEFDGTAAVFARAERQLDLLIKVQNQSYQQNLAQVVGECLREEQAAATVADGEAGGDLAQADEWLRRVRRLKEDHWLLFDAHTEEPKRLKVGWIASRTGKYVFVNVLGKKDRIVAERDLASLLREGSVVVLDAADEPAMDRAQYSMLQNLHRQLLHQASHDPLTGLINRREFEKCVTEALGDAKYGARKHALLFIDVDQFKVVNTTFGYDAGDQFLKEFTLLLQENLGERHILARIGVDQFGVLLQEHSIDDALAVAEEKMDAVHDYRFEWNEERLSFSVSVGLVGINAQGESGAALLQSAEASCTVAKELGGRRVQIHHARNTGLVRRKEEMKWAVKIDQALDDNTLRLRCQKIVPIQSQLSQQVHYELLLGLSEELSGQMNLEEFIRAAEHYKRVLEVDRWVIREAFNWIAGHEDELLGIASFSINLSGPSLNHEKLIEFINEQAVASGVDMQRICFEITETAGITNLSDASDFIHVIKSSGCKFSLDDFGSGMSSYAYLKSLPVDYLKIDGVFVQDIVQSPSDLAVVKSVCEVGHFMGKAVIAEFVQDEAAVSLLRDVGVDYVQGYGIERPHALDELLRA